MHALCTCALGGAPVPGTQRMSLDDHSLDAETCGGGRASQAREKPVRRPSARCREGPGQEQGTGGVPGARRQGHGSICVS